MPLHLNFLNFFCRYGGHCPAIKFDYGDTYGSATSKYFQDYRSSVLNSSKSNYSHGGRFPSYYTHNPDLVMSIRSRTWDRWLHSPKYKLNNINHGKKEAQDKFYQVRKTLFLNLGIIKCSEFITSYAPSYHGCFFYQNTLSWYFSMAVAIIYKFRKKCLKKKLK